MVRKNMYNRQSACKSKTYVEFQQEKYVMCQSHQRWPFLVLTQSIELQKAVTIINLDELKQKLGL